MKRFLVVSLALLLSLGCAVQAFGTEAAGPGSAAAGQQALAGIELPADAGVLVLVESQNEPVNATGTLCVYTRQVTVSPETGQPVSATPWEMVIAPARAVMGRKGMGKTAEGDEKTPLGLFRMNTPFGIQPAEEGFPKEYLQVGPQHYWSSDQTDRAVSTAAAGPGAQSTVCSTYNRLMDIRAVPELSRKASEHLIDITEEYKYCLNIGYNEECKKGAGSALFLHCINHSSDRGTGGCVAVDEQIMKQVLRLYQPGSTYMLIRNK